MAACGHGDFAGAFFQCKPGILAGDLVITEIMANPAGEPESDTDSGEWLEFFNATGHAIDLEGVLLAASGPDTGGMRTHTMAGAVVAPGAYFAAGRGLPKARAGAGSEYLDYGYGDDLADLPDSAGRLAIQCNTIEIDAVEYTGAQSGVAMGLTGAIYPDYLVNDDPARFCSATRQYASGNLGTPGERNDCVATAPGRGGRCNDGGSAREVITPAPGDVVITEIMANPAEVSDSHGEWFEIYIARGVDLNGVGIGRELPGDDGEPAEPDLVLDSADCLHAAAGSYKVFARSAEMEQNGGIAGVDHEFGFGLKNSGGTLVIAAGSTVLDHAHWASSPEGAALNLDPDFFDPADNDRAELWCPSSSAGYGSGDRGTPGADNLECAIFIPGLCNDDGGVMRPVVQPVAGQATITEYMANPNGVADTSGEWLEVRFDGEVDLNGLELGRIPGTVLTTVESAECLRVAAGTHVVFARAADPAVNGGLPPVAAEIDFGLVNTGGSVFIAADGTTLDSVTYAGSTAGAAASLDEAGGVTWCVDHANPYGPGDNSGTPGGANPGCASE